MEHRHLSNEDAQKLLHIALRVVRHQYPQHAKSMNSIARLIVEKKAPKTAMFSSLKHMVGQKELRRIFRRVYRMYLLMRTND